MQKLLLVDDDISILKQFSFALSNKYDILEAQNREEASLLIAKNQDIAIALVDLGLPPFENSHKEGRLIISKLLDETEAKVIVLTGQESNQYAQEFIEMGVFDYIIKPVSIESLISSLQRASFFIHNSQQNKNQVRLNFHISPDDGLKASSDEAQKQLLTKILNKTNFNINQTSKILNISRENCYYFLKKFNIQR